MSGIDYLPWDSHFFSLKIGKIEIEGRGNQFLDDALMEARNEAYQLLYVFSRNNSLHWDSLFNGFSIQHVDLKRTYSLDLNGTVPKSPSPEIGIFPSDGNASILYELAYQSGEYSRYRVDHKFSESDFKRMYRQWIDNCLTGDMADVVFVYKTNDLISGFITLKTQNNGAVIGLIATDRGKRNQGIGKSLLSHVKSFAKGSGVSTLTVTTQGANINACRFYEHNGFLLRNELNVYHCWL